MLNPKIPQLLHGEYILNSKQVTDTVALGTQSSHHLSSICTQNESSQEDCSLISSSHSPAPSGVNPSHKTAASLVSHFFHLISSHPRRTEIIDYPLTRKHFLYNHIHDSTSISEILRADYSAFVQLCFPRACCAFQRA